MIANPCQQGYQLNSQGACVPISSYSPNYNLFIVLGLLGVFLLLGWYLGR